jgi:hypothetical protein
MVFMDVSLPTLSTTATDLRLLRGRFQEVLPKRPSATYNNVVDLICRTLLLALLLPGLSAAAQNVRSLPVEDMSREAQVIGVATVVSAIPHEEPRNGFVYTNFRLEFSEVWKGEAGPAFILMKPGGTVGAIRSSIPGHEYILNPGERIVVFATPSDLGNHVPIGIHQGLYRVGTEKGSPLYRVTQFPFGPGKGSALMLQSLKDDVYRSLGKPVESRPAPEPRLPAPLEPGSPPAVPPREAAPPQEPTPGAPLGSSSAGVLRGIGFLVVCLLLAAAAGFFFLKRKSPPQG